MTSPSNSYLIPIIRTTKAELTPANKRDHLFARLGMRRENHRVIPGLYALGSPNAESPVFVSANYTLSFDALRSSLKGFDAYILVLNTHGINVWCAAGKGTFGTDEIIRKISQTHLAEVVSHRTLILPQLGAPGVAAHEVKKSTGFTVEYGPVRAADLPEYLKTHTATPAMRIVEFPLKDRLVLIPVEFNAAFFILLAVSIVAFLIGGWSYFFGVWVAVIGGTVLFPILLPWLPTPNFSSKGFVLGLLLSIPFVLAAFITHPDWPWWYQTLQALVYVLTIPSVIAFLSLNFTGSTTFTSRTGVRKEMYRYIPVMSWSFIPGVIILIALIFIH